MKIRIEQAFHTCNHDNSDQRSVVVSLEVDTESTLIPQTGELINGRRIVWMRWITRQSGILPCFQLDDIYDNSAGVDKAVEDLVNQGWSYDSDIIDPPAGKRDLSLKRSSYSHAGNSHTLS